MVKNYTSQVPSVRSVNHIEMRLVRHGAKNILKLYEQQRLTGIAFVIIINGREMPFRLPARIERVRKQLESRIKRLRTGTLDRIAEQAERTAWKLLSDWVDIQISLVELDQVDLVEVFMPYIYDSVRDQTFFEKVKNEGFVMVEDKRTKK